VRPTLRGFLALSPLTAVGVVTLLAQTKLLAVLIGPEGVGFFALAVSFIALVTAVAGLGLSTSLTKLVAEFGSGGRKDDIWGTTLVGVATVTVASVVLGALIVLNQGPIGRAFLGGSSVSTEDRSFIIGVTALGLIPIILNGYFSGLLKGLRNLRDYVVSGSLATAFPAAGALVGAAIHGERGAVAGSVLGQVPAVAILVYFAVRVTRREGLRVDLWAGRSRLVALERGLIALGLFALVAGLAGGFGQNLARTQIAAHFDLRAVGFFSAAWAISNRLPILVYQTLTSYIMPKISSLARDWTAIIKEQNDACRISLLVITPALCLAAAAGPWIVPIILSDRFLPMVTLLQLMFVGELLSVVLWAEECALYPSGRALTSTIAEWAFWVVFIAGVAVAVTLGHLTAIGFAYIAAQATLVVAVYMWEKRHHDFRWRPENARLIGLSLGAIVGTTLVSTLTNLPTVVVVALAMPLLASWALLSLTRSERGWLLRAVSRGLGMAD
jgi:O-antigen/teichoic acid export membrane protein